MADKLDTASSTPQSTTEERRAKILTERSNFLRHLPKRKDNWSDISGNGRILKRVNRPAPEGARCIDPGARDEVAEVYYLGMVVSGFEDRIESGSLRLNEVPGVACTFDQVLHPAAPFVYHPTRDLEENITGWTQCLAHMTVGEQATLLIAPEHAYGKTGRGQLIPPNSWLMFEVQLVSVGPPKPYTLGVMEKGAIFLVLLVLLLVLWTEREAVGLAFAGKQRRKRTEL